MKRSILFLFVFSLSLPLLGADLKIEPGQKYLLLATTKTSTMQEELNQAAALGFRVITGSPTSGSEMAVLLEQTGAETEPYQYLLLATTRTGTMQKELNAAAQKGFRLLPSTMIAKNQAFGGVEVVVLMEKAPGKDQTYKYQLLATNRTSTLQKEILEYLDYGFTLIGMVSRGEHMVIMEQEVPIQ